MRHFRYLLAVGLLIGGCDGNIDEVPSTMEDPIDPVDPESPTEEECLESPAIAGIPIRILTSREFNNALAELFPTAELSEQAIAFDGRIEAFVFNSRDPIVAEHVAAFRTSAEQLAAELVAQLDEVMDCRDGEAAPACAQRYLSVLGARAYRRPLADAERDGLIALYDIGAVRSHEEGMRTAFEGLLQSPSFLYVHESPEGLLTGHEIAQRLSATFARSVPDDALLAAAEDGSLMDPAARVEHAERLLDSELGRVALNTLVSEWFGIDRLFSSQLAQEEPMLAEGFARETELFIEQLVATGSASFTELLSAQHTYVNAEMAEHYGLSLDGAEDVGDGWFRVELDDRAGILTQGSFLAQKTDPVHRGLAIRETVMCGHVPGPDEVDVTAVSTFEGQSERSKAEDRLEHAICGGCHTRMDPIGLAFDGYDELGRERTEDQFGNPVFTDGEVLASDNGATVSGPQELGLQLSESQDVRDCVATQLFAWTYGRTAGATDACELAVIGNALETEDNDLRRALLAAIASNAFVTRAGGDR